MKLSKKNICLIFISIIAVALSFSGCSSIIKKPLTTYYKNTTLSDFHLDEKEYEIKEIKKEFLTSDFITTKFYCEDLNGRKFEISKTKDGLVDNYINIKATETATTNLKKQFNTLENIDVLCDCRVLDDPSYGYGYNDSSFYDYEKNLSASPYYYVWKNSDSVNIYIFYSGEKSNEELNNLYINSIDILNNCYNEYLKDINRNNEELSSIKYCYIIKADDDFNINNLTGDEIFNKISEFGTNDNNDKYPFYSIKSFYLVIDKGEMMFEGRNDVR